MRAKKKLSSKLGQAALEFTLGVFILALITLVVSLLV